MRRFGVRRKAVTVGEEALGPPSGQPCPPFRVDPAEVILTGVFSADHVAVQSHFLLRFSRESYVTFGISVAPGHGGMLCIKILC